MIGNKEDIKKYLSNFDSSKYFEINEYYEKKTLSQNSYCWELIGQIANKLRQSKNDVYKQLLFDYGQSVLVSIQEDKDHIDDGFFKYYKLIGKGEVNGKKFNHYLICRGISEYNVKEMGIFIDGVLSECFALNIKTMDADRIKELRL